VWSSDSASTVTGELHSEVESESEMDGEEKLEPGEGGDALELESDMDGHGSGETRARHAGQRPSEAGPWSHFVSSRNEAEWRRTDTTTHGGDVFPAKDMCATGRADG
jgi:hypothetical protein